MPERRTDELRRGRLSVLGARYFVTFVSEGRKPWLGDDSTRIAMLTALRTWHDEGDGRVLAATVMPDHVHVFIQLGARHSVGQLVGRWKASVTRACPGVAAWQRDFWEHRLRDAESGDDYGLYILLNPYRSGDCAADVTWPGWWLPDAGVFRFATALDQNGVPPKEWLGWPEERFAGLVTGDV